MIEGSISL